MRQFYIFCTFLIFSFIGVNAQLGTDTFIIASDDAGNYSTSPWNNGSNEGENFEAWSFSSSGGGSKGNYIGGTGQDSPSFGIFADAFNSITVSRPLGRDLLQGETISLNIGATSVNTGAELLIQLVDNNNIEFTLKFVGGQTNWLFNDGGSDFSTGQAFQTNTSIIFSFTYEGGNQYSSVLGSNSINSATANNTIDGIDEIRIINNGQGSGNNFGFDDLQIESIYTIPNGDSSDVTSDTTVPYLEIQSGGSVTVNAGEGLTVTGNFDNSGTVTLNSNSQEYSSLIVEGTATGEVIYNRFVNLNTGTAGGNDLISPPLSGQTWSDFLDPSTSNALDLLDNGGTSPIIYAFAPFDKTAVPADFVNFTDATSATLTSGLGYRAATDTGTTLTFTGTPLTGLVDPQISNGGTGFEEWNLIGNPYPSYISAFDFLNHNINNNAVLNNLAGAIYAYNALDVDNYDIINLSTVSGPGNDILIAPGQGFFVASGVPVGNIEFTTAGTPSDPDMRRSGGGDDFIAGRTAENYNLELEIVSGVEHFSTDFYFNENSSLGLNPGYDAKLFGENVPDFSIYSHLVEDNTGIPMGIQSLSDADLQDVVIPLGVNANQGAQLTFSISESSLNGSIEVFLDDTVANTSTLLTTGDYTLTPTTDLNGTGRFFLRFSTNALSLNDNPLNALTIYANAADKVIVVAGQLTVPTIATIYDLQGRSVASSILDSTTTRQTIDTRYLSTGVYVVQLANADQSITQKVIIR